MMPIGPLRALEPHRGIDVDVTVITIAVVSVVVVMAGHAVINAVRVPSDSSRRARIVDVLPIGGRSPSIAMGVRRALDPGRGDAAIPLRSTVLGVGVAVAALVATLVYSAGLGYFTSTPRMYGWIWGYQVESGGVASTAALQQVADTLTKDPHVHAAAVGAYGQLTIRGRTIGAIAVRGGRGVPIVEVASGREPRRAGELALGAVTLRSLHEHVGGRVEVGVGSVTREFTIVGTGVFARFAPYPASEPTGLGVGAAMTLDGLARFGPLDGAKPNSPLAASPFVLVDVAAGTPARAIDHLAFPRAPGSGFVLPAQRPNDALSYEHLRRTPLILTGLLLLLAIATLAHLLMSGVRRRRRELAVARALGFTSGQLRVSVLAQASTIVLAVMIVTVPLGVVAGRVLWGLTADWLGIRVHNVVPAGEIALVAVGALVVGNVAALVPAIGAGRVKPARILRRD